jgi:hypothetical protein
MAEKHQLSRAEILEIATRVGTMRDRRGDAAANALLRSLAKERGPVFAHRVAAEMERQSKIRYREVMRVYEGLPCALSLEEALRVKAKRGDLSARGWTKQADGVYTKTV